MFYFLSLLTGIIIAVMIAINGGLTGQYGIYMATVIIHLAGLPLTIVLLLIKRDKVFSALFSNSHISWVFFMGGAVGFTTTVFNNLSFGRISVSALLALGLLGQAVTGLVIDQYGLLGMKKHPFSKRKIIGLVLIVLGIVYMINSIEILAVVLSFLAGVSIVVSRTLNAGLSSMTNMRIATFCNYMVGLVVAALALFVLGRGEMAAFYFAPNVSTWWIYFGGVLGVCIVLISNVTVVKISAFYLTLLVFIGKIFAGILIDVVLAGYISSRNLIGGVLVAFGLCANLFLDSRPDR